MRRPALALLLGCLLLVAGASADPWWNASWEKRVPLTVTNASATEGMQALYNVTYDSDMQSDFDDLRFVQDDGTTPIDYWIETKSDSNYALCWLELPASEALVYQYYGNPDAESESDVDAVMEFGDVFDSSLDWSNNWQSTNQALYSASGGYLTITTTSTTGQLIQTKNKYSNFRARVSARVATAGKQLYVSTDTTAGTWANKEGGIIDWLNSPDNVKAQIAGSQTVTNEAENTSQYYEIDFTLPASGDATISISKNGGSALVTRTASPTNREVYLSMFGYSGGGTCYSRYIYIREYAATEPTLSAGSEETIASAPTPAFTANTTAGLAPLTVQFTDTSANTPTSWSWDINNDGTPDYSTQNPTHTYTAAGTYSVNLTATNEHGSDHKLKTAYITVYAPITAQFTANATGGTAPVTVQFTDRSTGGPTSWSWTFGDGNTSTDQNPAHTYTTAGAHTVTLTASHPYDSDTETKTAYITVAVLQPFPGLALIPRDLTGNGLYTDINGNGRLDYNDLTIFFQNLAWAKTAQPIACFDFNGNGWLDYNDVITLFSTIMEEHT